MVDCAGRPRRGLRYCARGGLWRAKDRVRRSPREGPHALGVGSEEPKRECAGRPGGGLRGGSAESSAHDQILDTIYVGPVPEGRHMFVFQVDFYGAKTKVSDLAFNKHFTETFQADAPDHTKIPVKDLLGATVVLISCSYHGQEFIRVGL